MDNNFLVQQCLPLEGVLMIRFNHSLYVLRCFWKTGHVKYLTCNWLGLFEAWPGCPVLMPLWLEWVGVGIPLPLCWGTPHPPRGWSDWYCSCVGHVSASLAPWAWKTTNTEKLLKGQSMQFAIFQQSLPLSQGRQTTLSLQYQSLHEKRGAIKKNIVSTFQ